jgi:hypothetical protein
MERWRDGARERWKDRETKRLREGEMVHKSEIENLKLKWGQRFFIKAG